MQERSAEILYAQGYGFYQAGLYYKAKDCFRALTLLYPNDYNYWFSLGASYQMLKDYKAATDAYAASALNEKQEKDPAPHFHAAECLIALRQYEKAKIALKSAEVIAKEQEEPQKILEKIKILRSAIKEVLV